MGTLAFPLEQGLFAVGAPATFRGVSTVQEIKAAIDALSPGERAELERWLCEACPPIDPEVDSPELEAQLLKAVNGPHAPFRSAELREIADRAIRDHLAE